jgi:hypothetical protein
MFRDYVSNGVHFVSHNFSSSSYGLLMQKCNLHFAYIYSYTFQGTVYKLIRVKKDPDPCKNLSDTACTLISSPSHPNLSSSSDSLAMKT